MSDSWAGLLLETVREGLARVAVVVPLVLGALLLVAAGVVVGMLARAIVVRLLGTLDRPFRQWGVDETLARAGLPWGAKVVGGRVVFWAFVVLSVLLALDLLAPPGSGGMSLLVIRLLPAIVAAILMLVAGWLVGDFLGQAVLIAAVNARMREARLLARAVRLGVMTFAAAMALTHLGIAKEMVLVAFSITFGGLVLALALAFGLGGRHLARQALERRLSERASPVRAPDEAIHL